MGRDIPELTREFRRATEKLVSSLSGTLNLVDVGSVDNFSKSLWCHNSECYHPGDIYFSHLPINVFKGEGYRWNCSQVAPVNPIRCPHSIFVEKLNSRKDKKTLGPFVRQKLWKFKIICGFTLRTIYAIWCETGAKTPCVVSCASNCGKYTNLARINATNDTWQSVPTFGVNIHLGSPCDGNSPHISQHTENNTEKSSPTSLLSKNYSRHKRIYDDFCARLTLSSDRIQNSALDLQSICECDYPSYQDSTSARFDEFLVQVSEEDLSFLREFMSHDEICNLGW